MASVDTINESEQQEWLVAKMGEFRMIHRCDVGRSGFGPDLPSFATGIDKKVLELRAVPEF